MSPLLIAGAGFLAGVLWMDLLFDTQIMRLPAEHAVTVISAYYKNATLDAYPMNRLIGLIMLLVAAGALVQFVRGRVDRGLAFAGAVTAFIPVGLALTRVVPNAMLLGSRAGSAEQQIGLARSILFDHVVCLAFILTFIAIQVTAIGKRTA